MKWKTIMSANRGTELLADIKVGNYGIQDKPSKFSALKTKNPR